MQVPVSPGSPGGTFQGSSSIRSAGRGGSSAGGQGEAELRSGRAEESSAAALLATRSTVSASRARRPVAVPQHQCELLRELLRPRVWTFGDVATEMRHLWSLLPECCWGCPVGSLHDRGCACTLYCYTSAVRPSSRLRDITATRPPPPAHGTSPTVHCWQQRRPGQPSRLQRPVVAIISPLLRRWPHLRGRCVVPCRALCWQPVCTCKHFPS
jgi:hypothetical protein